MGEMDGDEVLAGVVAGVAGLMAACRWYFPLWQISSLGARRGQRRFLALWPLFWLALLLPVLLGLSAREVRTDFRYVILFLITGAAWIFAGGWITSLLGVSARADAIERANPAALPAVAGAQAGLASCFIFANMGEGPTIWTTIGPAALASIGLLALWAAVEMTGGFSEAVTVERDPASGLRLGGYLFAAGMILGRAVAGDWVSAAGTIRDFFQLGWPAAVLGAALVVLQRIHRPSPEAPRLDPIASGLLPAFALLTLAAGWLLYLGGL